MPWPLGGEAILGRIPKYEWDQGKNGLASMHVLEALS
jgi:hypothetical protein